MRKNVNIFFNLDQFQALKHYLPIFNDSLEYMYISEVRQRT